MKLNKLIQALALAGLSTQVFAQDAAQQDAATDPNAKVERIRVTGSSIKRTTIEGDLPITVFSRADINAAGITSAEQLLLQMNIAGNSSDNLASNGGITSEDQRNNNGVSGANLRGQGSDATLVLLNGRRVATHGLKGRAVDLNSIPFAALERVEVLRDGASAVYGTDAIGGVINFITKSDYTGAEASAFVDHTEAGGGNIYRTNLLLGTGDINKDGWNVFGTLSYKKNEVLGGDDRKFSTSFQPERGLSPDSRGTPFATVFGQVGSMLSNRLIDPDGGATMATAAVNILDLPGGAGCVNGGDLMSNYDHQLWGSSNSKYSCAYDYPAAARIQQPQDSIDFIGRASFKLAEQHMATIELVASQVDVSKAFEPSQITSSTSASAIFNPSTWYPSTGESYDAVYNALANYFGADQLNYGDRIAYRWRCMECGSRELDTTTKAYRFLAAFEGVVANWDYNVGVSRALSKSESKLGTGFYYTDELQQVLGSGLINPFLMPGQSQTAEGKTALNAASAYGVKLFGGESIMTQIDATFSGELPLDLPGGTIMMATGVDLRREEFKFNGDERTEMRPIFNAPFDNPNVLNKVSRDIKAVFAEVYLPVLENLDITLAARYDKYDGFGSTSNPKISFSYRPIEELMFRGAYSTGFKVPSFNQLFNGVTESQYTGLDLADPATCPGGIANENVAGCASIRPDEIFGGKADLLPEESKQKSFGFVVVPIDYFNVSIDWWEIERTDTIRSAPRDILIENYNLFTANWIRNAQGEVIAIDRRYINSGGTLTRGIELDANLTGELAGGLWRVNLNGSYIDTFKSKGLESLPYSDNLVGEYVRFYNLPLKWKHTLNLSYVKGDWSHSLTQMYRHSYNDELPLSIANDSFTPSQWNPKVASYTTYNYSVTYKGVDDLSLTFGIKNLLDQDPSFTAHQGDYAAGAGWETRIADPRGRAYTLLIEYKFM